MKKNLRFSVLVIAMMMTVCFAESTKEMVTLTEKNAEAILGAEYKKKNKHQHSQKRGCNR